MGSQPATTEYRALPNSPILELVLEGKPVAVAVKKRCRRLHMREQAPTSHARQDQEEGQHARQHSSSQTDSTESEGNEFEIWTCFYDMDGTVLAIEREGNLHKDGVAGPHTHTVLTGQTPLVRHMHVVFTAAGRLDINTLLIHCLVSIR